MLTDPYGEEPIGGTILFVTGAAFVVTGVADKSLNIAARVAGVAVGGAAMGVGAILFLTPANGGEGSDNVLRPGMGDLRGLEGRHTCP